MRDWALRPGVGSLEWIVGGWIDSAGWNVGGLAPVASPTHDGARFGRKRSSRQAAAEAKGCGTRGWAAAPPAAAARTRHLQPPMIAPGTISRPS